MSAPDAHVQGALVMRWLCHDMATPIATLVTASDLLGDMGDTEINQLITVAIRRLSARLRLVRLAAGSQMRQTMASLEKLLCEALPDTPLSLACSDDGPVPANVLAGAALILSDHGGTAAFEIDAAGARWRDGRGLPAQALAALAGQVAEDPRTAMVWLVARQAEASGWRLMPVAGGLAFEAV